MAPLRFVIQEKVETPRHPVLGEVFGYFMGLFILLFIAIFISGGLALISGGMRTWNDWFTLAGALALTAWVVYGFFHAFMWAEETMAVTWRQASEHNYRVVKR